jgi:Tol biopolymer transport system component
MYSNYRYSFVFGFLLLMGLTIGAISATASPGGNTRLYMPLVGRAEPALSEYIGLTFSRGPSYPIFEGPDSEIYQLRADGSERIRLTDNEWQDESPQWSPDGTYILWRQFDNTSTTSTYNDLWIMNADGTNARNLTNSPAQDYGVWSPTENVILVRAYDPNAPISQNLSLYLTTPTASALNPIIENVDFTAYAWSPTGAYISFLMQRVVNDQSLYDLYTVQGDGSNLTLLVANVAQNHAWSPTGEWIAYTDLNGANVDTYIIRPDGSETRQLTSETENESFMAWVEGGARLLSEQGDVGVNLITVANGTTTPFLVYEDQRRAYVHNTSPDGTKVAYQYDDSGWDSTLYVQATDSMTRVQVSPDLECQATFCNFNFGGWSTDSTQLSYAYYYSYTPSSGYGAAYLATLGNDGATYQQLEGNTGIPRWLPYGSWAAASSNREDTGNTLYLINNRTNEIHAMPLSEDETRLIQSEWRYLP